MKIIGMIMTACYFVGTMMAAEQEGKPAVSHPTVGTEVISKDRALKFTLLDKRQSFDWSDESTLDKDVISPKSIYIAPQGWKYYVNSLEGARTVVYENGTNRKLGVINYNFNHSHASLWAPESGLFTFNHYFDNTNCFSGKPVEATFTHRGHYLWVTFYRRSFDINAQDPSAIAIIDTRNDRIVRIMEAGVLPKMILASPDGKTVAVIHWGDNTVGLIDASSYDPMKWQYRACVVVGYKYKPDFSLTQSVNRDVGSGYCLRGAAFSPDNKYLFVGAMGGGGGIAVIDVANSKYQGMMYGMMSNIRHMVVSNNSLYLTINKNGYVQKTNLNTFLDSVSMNSRRYTNWENVKVGSGARSLIASKDGKYLFVACNSTSQVCVVDSERMEVIAELPADSYPVGINLSNDGSFLYVTSQGHNHLGGNSLAIYQITHL